MNTKEKIEIMQAFLKGKKIQVKVKGTNEEFKDFISTKEPTWDWTHFEYRVKPEPLELWVNKYDFGNYTIHESKEEAIKYCDRANVRKITIHMKEVIDD